MTAASPAVRPSCASLELLRGHAREATSARVFLSGPDRSYSTQDLLRLRADHALARDALSAEIGPEHPAIREIAATYGLVGLESRAASHREYLLRPDLGRRLSAVSTDDLSEQGTQDADLQVILGDGLSPHALAAHAPAMVAGLHTAAAARNWTFGMPLFVRRARVGVLDAIGDITGCRVAVLLIGERPGLQTPRSLSAYLAYRPRGGHTDADRNLVCNIQRDGLCDAEALGRVVSLAATLASRRTSGVAIKEAFGPSHEFTRETR
jgi:ethanolamine ammonia-lyase small subunit